MLALQICYGSIKKKSFFFSSTAVFVRSGTGFYHKLRKNFFTIPAAFAKACKMTDMKTLYARAKQKNDI